MSKAGIISTTEIINDSCNPVFQTSLICDSYSQLDRNITFNIYDANLYHINHIQQGIIATISFKLNDLLHSLSLQQGTGQQGTGTGTGTGTEALLIKLVQQQKMELLYHFH